jgi:hypothetical protein
MEYNVYTEAVKILCDPDSPSYRSDVEKAQMVLEDVNSPVTRKYHEKMYSAIINKAHIDFGDIPKSRGNIKNYSGYATMLETLKVLDALSNEEHAVNVQRYVKIIMDALKNIELLSSTFEKGFSTKTEYVAMEYDVYVYFCVEATTALLYSFVDYVKSPDKQVMDIKLVNTKLRADEFYFDQLQKFNMAQNKVGMEYRKMLEQMCTQGKDNFIGTSTAIGVGTVMLAAMAIVPITRELIYQIYNFRGKLSEHLEMQSHFLEMNATCVQNNDLLTADKKNKILQKQEKLAAALKKMSDAIRVKSSKSILDSKRELQKDNKMLSIDSIKEEISNSPFDII